VVLHADDDGAIERRVGLSMSAAVKPVVANPEDSGMGEGLSMMPGRFSRRRNRSRPVAVGSETLAPARSESPGRPAHARGPRHRVTRFVTRNGEGLPAECPRAGR
jgi:hypothetical protein